MCHEDRELQDQRLEALLELQSRAQYPGNIWRGDERSYQCQKLIAQIVYIIFGNTFLHIVIPLTN